MPKVVDATTQRRLIRRAARRVFSRRGLEHTGLEHVARRAGMGRATLYHYYPDKAALVRDLAAELLDEEQALLAATLRGEGSPAARVERLVEALVSLFDPWAEVGRMLLDLRFVDARRFRAFFRRARASLAHVLAEARAAGEVDAHLDCDLAAAAILGLVDGLLLQHLVDRAAFPDGTALARHTVEASRRMLQLSRA